MNVKINTKEKFQEISVLEAQLTANMTADIEATLLPFLHQTTKNVILIMDTVENIENEAADILSDLQRTFMEANASFVICELSPTLLKAEHLTEFVEGMNLTPTLSEAWDIVQMDEIERDLLSDF